MISLNVFATSNNVTLGDDVIAAFDSLGATLMQASVGIAPAPPTPLDLTSIANAIASPHAPEPSAIQFLSMLSLDITTMILVPLTTGAAGLLLIPPVVVPPPPIVTVSASILSAMTPPQPNLAKTMLQWAASFVLPADLRAPGGFIVS